MAKQRPEDILDKVLTDYKRAWEDKQRKDVLFREIYRRYRSYLDVSTETTRSTLFIPESFTLVETVAPRLTARKPTFKVLPRESSDISDADTVGQLLSYQYDMMDLQQKIKRYSKQSLIYGTSFVKVGWDNDKKMPAVEPVDIADILGDPTTWSWEKGYIIHRHYMTDHELKNSKIKYQRLNQLNQEDTTTLIDQQTKQDRLTIEGRTLDPKIDGHEILEWWGFVDGTIRVRAVADRRVLIRDEDTPFKLNELPFVAVFDQEVPFEKWGIGEIEPILDLQDEENTTRNQRIDEKNLSIHNMWVVSKVSGIDHRRIVSKPGGIILANDINGIKPLDKQNITQNSMEEIRLIKEDIRNATGVNDYIRGTGTGTDTATEVVSKTQEANQRFADKANNLEIALKKIGQWMVALNAQYLASDQIVRITGKYGTQMEKVTLDAIRGQYDIDIETGSSLPANPDIRRKQLTELLQVVAPFLTNPNGIPDGMRELLRTIIQSYDLKNADEILQGAEHPLVSQIMAQLLPEEMQGTNRAMVEEYVKREATAGGMLMPQMEQKGQPPAAAPMGSQLPAPPSV